MTESNEAQKRIIETMDLTRQPNGRIGYHCPHCDHVLPVNGITECDKCGAHLEVLVRTTAPPLDEVATDDLQY